MDSSATADPVSVFNVHMASLQQQLTPPYFFSPHWKSGRAKCAPVNEMLVISIAHCLPSSSSTALLCIREELSVPLVLKEVNGTEPTKFYEGLPWPSRSKRPWWRGLIMWDLVCKRQRLKMKTCCLLLHRLFWGFVPCFIHLSEWLLKWSPLSLALEKFSTWEILRLICSIMWAQDPESIFLRSMPRLYINGWWITAWLEIHLSSLQP